MATETLRPDAPGDECNISDEIGVDCPNHYQNVDEVDTDEDTTKNRSASIAYERDFYNVVDHSVGSGTINHITVYARCKGNYEVLWASLKIAIKSGTGEGVPDTPNESVEKTITTSFTNYSNQWTTNPATTAAFTWDEIDRLQIGIALKYCADDPANMHSDCTQVYVVVDYTAEDGNVTVTPGTISLTLTGYAPILKEVLTPTTLSLATTKYAPVLKEVITPSTLSLTTTGYAPALKEVLTPQTLALTLTFYAPTASPTTIYFKRIVTLIPEHKYETQLKASHKYTAKMEAK